MIKQIISEQATFKTPSFQDVVSINVGLYPQSVSKQYSVTEERIVELKNVQVESGFSGVVVDAAADVKGVPFAIFVTYPGRKVPEVLLKPSNRTSGVVEIDAGLLPKYFSSALVQGKSYRAALAEYLAKEAAGKSWVYHPRQEQARNAALKELKQEWAAQKACLPQRHRKAVFSKLRGVKPARVVMTRAAGTLKDFHCLDCGERWQGWLPADVSCKKCGTHLFVSTKEAEG